MQITAPPETPDPVAEPQVRRGHQHGRRCYWDLRECRWVCRVDDESVAPVSGG